jgi:TolB-like protein/Tfp pilus assembly protein PilF
VKYSTPELTPELVRKQLNRLLNQDELKRSPVLAKFLNYVVVSKLEGRADEIKDYTIAVKGLGRPADFNPQIDSSVRIHAGRLRRTLIEYYLEKGKDDLVIIIIPKGTYVPVFNAKATGEVDSQQVYSQNEFKEHARVRPPYKIGLMKPVLAVLPFHDLSLEPSNFFLTAFGEQLNTEISRFENISVISYYATEHFNLFRTELKDIRNQLEVDYILTGSLRISNGTLRLNIQLLIVDSGNILWSDTYTRQELTLENSYDILDEIVRKVANIVADDDGIISDLNRFKHLEDKGRHLSHEVGYTYNNDAEKFKATLSAIENSYDDANSNVMVISLLATLYLDQYAFSTCDEPQLLAKGKEFAARAIHLDPRNQHAKKAFAWGQILSGEKEKSLEAIERCIALNPTASSVLGNMGLGMILLGDYQTGYSMLRRSQALHQRPSVYAKFGLALYHYQDNNFEESSKWLARMIPFDIPFSCLLKLSINGYMNYPFAADEQLPGNLTEEALSTIGRIIFDRQLVNKIVNGCKMAGLALKEAI